MGALQIYIVVVDDDDDDVLRVSTAFHFAIKNDVVLHFHVLHFQSIRNEYSR